MGYIQRYGNLSVVEGGGDCSAVMIVDIILLLLLSVISAAFSALRVFASSGRDWPLTSLTGFLALMQFITNLAIYSKTTYSVAHLPYFGAVCNQSFDMSYSIITKNLTHIAFRNLYCDGYEKRCTLLVLNVLDLALFVPKIYLNVGMNFVIPWVFSHSRWQSADATNIESQNILDIGPAQRRNLTANSQSGQASNPAHSFSELVVTLYTGWQDKTSSNQAVEAIELTLL
ncbi:predicted protein [Postia placenta Mad-698-R]|nr:predicted protein [Postia placenta Mad-698-R]